MSIKPHPYVPPRWVAEGDEVFIPWPTPEKPRQGMRVKVVVAAGNHCRVVSGSGSVDKWVRLDDCLVPDDDPRA